MLSQCTWTSITTGVLSGRKVRNLTALECGSGVESSFRKIGLSLSLPQHDPLARLTATIPGCAVKLSMSIILPNPGSVHVRLRNNVMEKNCECGQLLVDKPRNA